MIEVGAGIFIKPRLLAPDYIIILCASTYLSIYLIAAYIKILYFASSWEEGKLLLNKNNFFKDLEFYNMTGMPDSIFNALKGFYDNPLFIADIVKDGSVAARSLCLWVRAVYEFCMVHRALEPKRQQLQRAEQELEKVFRVMSGTVRSEDEY